MTLNLNVLKTWQILIKSHPVAMVSELHWGYDEKAL
jgi:hypothetical protein